MPVSPARHAAFTILRRTQSGENFAVALMQTPEFSGLMEADRSLTTELVMGVLRRREELNREIERLSGRSIESLDREVVIALQLGIYQMRFLERIPHSAAVNESVELVKLARKRSAAGLVNAVLRSFSSSPGVSQPTAVNLPSWLFARWVKNFGEETARVIAADSASRPPTCLRVCGATTSLEAIELELARDGVRTRRGRFAPRALIVESGNIKKSKAWQEGRVVVQDEGSQLVAELVRPRPGSRLLDLCAAPGMKMIQMAEVLVQGSLVACDVSAARLKTLKRFAEQHIPRGVQLDIRQLDATYQPPPDGPFDAVLVDAPCTGTGTLARHPEMKLRLKPADLERLQGIQVGILRQALAALAPGGRLIYATCSLEAEENEQVIEEVLGPSRGFGLSTAPQLKAEFPRLASYFSDPGYFRTLPGSGGLDRLDGFFGAVITRSD